jgi:hypothetical protein
MKTCRTCRRTYEDDTIVYCLDDGARLVDGAADSDATLNLPGPTIHANAQRAPAPATAANPATITASPEHFQRPDAPGPSSREPDTRKSPLPWVFAIVLVLGISGVLIAWLATRGSNDQPQGRRDFPTPMASPPSSPEATAEIKSEVTPDDRDARLPRPTPVPSREPPKTEFSVLNNMTFNGSRITYYPRPGFGQCQADCARNSSCRGFTWIRPGAYNPGDSAMCYLMSAVTARVPHACCISGVRN